MKYFGNIVAPPTPTPTPKPTATPTTQPTATPTPNQRRPNSNRQQHQHPNQRLRRPQQYTTLNMTVYLDGIGNRGDNTNPTGSSLSNKTPQHTSISGGYLNVHNKQQLNCRWHRNLTYNATHGDYTGDVPISAGFPTGYYVIKVKTHTHLRKQIEQIQQYCRRK